MPAWTRSLHTFCSADFFCDDPETAEDLAVLHRALADTASAIDDAGHDGPLAQCVARPARRAARGTGRLARFPAWRREFLPAHAAAQRPFSRGVCLLSMPRRYHAAPAFDLMARMPRTGDPSQRDDDRYLFLEALLSARDHLYISPVARDKRRADTNRPCL